MRSVWGLAVLWLLLATRAAAGLEGWTQRISRRRWLQGSLFFAALLVITALANLPLDIYAHSVSLRYGISVQGWTGWSLDLAKGLGLSLLFGPPILLLFNWIVRRWPRRYWLGIWAVTLPLMLFSAFVSPLLEPIFNHYEPLAQNHPALVAELEQVVARTGTNIPPDRMFLMKASAKTNGLNAYVSGIGATKRIVVWDTTAGRIPDDEMLFHLRPRERPLRPPPHPQSDCRRGRLAVLRLLGLRRFCRLARPPLWRRAGHLGAAGSWRTLLASRAGFVVLLFAISVASFLTEPPSTTPSAATSSTRPTFTDRKPSTASSPIPEDRRRRLQRTSARPGSKTPIPAHFWSSGPTTTPPSQTRATFAAHYDPWANGGHGQFFAK